MWNVEAFIHYRDMYDRDIELHTGDYFSYGSVFFEVTSYHIEKFMFGQVERVAGYRLVGKQTRVDHIDLAPKGPTEESFTGPDAIQKTFVQQRGKSENELGKTGDVRQLRKDGKLEEYFITDAISLGNWTVTPGLRFTDYETTEVKWSDEQARAVVASTSTKKVEVINIIQPTIKVLLAPEPTNARTISRVEIGAAKIS